MYMGSVSAVQSILRLSIGVVGGHVVTAFINDTSSCSQSTGNYSFGAYFPLE